MQNEELQKWKKAGEIAGEAREYGISLYGHEMFWRIIT